MGREIFYYKLFTTHYKLILNMKFKYHAKKVDGEDARGEAEAQDRFELAKTLRQQNLILISCEEAAKKKSFSFGSISFGKVSVADKMMFSRNLSIMIQAGLPLTRSLDILIRQTKNAKFKKILQAIMSEVQKGTSMSEAMKAFPKVFPPLFTAMVKVGEESGKLSESLRLLSEQLEKDHKLVKKIKGAMMYPTIVLIALLGIGIFMFIYVVPTLSATFAEIKMELPLSTRVIIAISNFMIKNSVLALLILAAVGVSGWLLFKIKKVQDAWDTTVLKLPIISPLAKMMNAGRITRTLSSLLSSGVNVVEALTITQDVLQNHHYKNILEQAKIETQKGALMSQSFKNAENYMPVLVGEMMAVGEETGELSAMLQRLAVFYEDEVSEATKDMSTVIEPILMLFIGVAVGFFAISMIRPMYSMMNGI